jgi:hypothetical protein
MTDRVKTRG